MVASLRVKKKKEIFRSVFRTLSNAYDEVFLAEVVNVFQQFPIFAKELRYKSSAIPVRHNPKYDSDIFYDFYCSTSLLFEANLTNFQNSFFSRFFYFP